MHGNVLSSVVCGDDSDDSDNNNDDLLDVPSWRVLQAATLMGVRVASDSLSRADTQVAGHAGTFKSEHGYLLKALTEGEAKILEAIQDTPLKQFIPQYMGRVERDGEHFLKMQDVLLPYNEPHVMDVKLGLRTFDESVASNPKRRPDLYEKAVKLKEHGGDVHLTEEDKEKVHAMRLVHVPRPPLAYMGVCVCVPQCTTPHCSLECAPMHMVIVHCSLLIVGAIEHGHVGEVRFCCTGAPCAVSQRFLAISQLAWACHGVVHIAEPRAMRVGSCSDCHKRPHEAP